MSKISDVYDQLLIKMAELFPNKKRIPYPKAIERNDDNFLKNSWGIWIGAVRIEQIDFCRHHFSREVEIILSKEVLRLEHDTANLDNAIKGLLEDSLLITKEFDRPEQIGIADKIQKIELISNNGIDEVFTETSIYMYTSIIFEITISENF